MRGTVGRRDPRLNVSQLNDFMDNQLKRSVIKLGKRSHMVDLQRQMQDNMIREETQRIYMDPKSIATSARIMKKVNPQMFGAEAAGDTLNLL